ncbi:MAG: class B sortase [Clostridiales bacterium]|nr:class B sortase [Clostridiales bacterium]
MAFASVLKIANTILSSVATATAVSVMAFSGYMLYENQYVQSRAYGSAMIQYKPEVQGDVVSIDALLANIPDASGWITIDDTHIDYPVVQGLDDVYYANHDVYQAQSLTGSIYIQAKNSNDFSDSYTLIYGHHMDNGAMFGDLSKYLDADFFNAHLSGSLVTLKEVYDIDVISVVKTNAYEKAIYDRTSLDWTGYQDLISNNADVRLVNSNPAITSADKFLVLSTCEGGITDGRVVLICSLTEEGKKVVPEPDQDGINRQDAAEDKGGKAVIVKTGEAGGKGGSWSIVNLFCLFLTFVTILPYALDFMDRKKEEKKTWKDYTGLSLNIILAILGAIIFILYENMTLPMAILNKYTPWMLIVLGLALATEEFCLKRKKKEDTLGEETADA